ncbi:hypothetical protein [Gulosibacter sp. 10]|uniref:hypothetical protein n=1 Tax=Gulosibacter sp. 10 TaxID=1255570 RepID=UPI00097F463E|nr:hypothetical protein [Gulosibacter sp. 10]SJM51826.1 Conserved protein [Gulosibacter sp. 10]
MSDVLEPLRQGRPARQRRWDWHEHRFLPHEDVQPAGLVVVEGCGALSRASRPLLDAAVWIDGDEAARRRRAGLRDGGDDWWEDWRAQEDAFYEAERSWELADLRLDIDGPPAGLDARVSAVREALAGEAAR